MPSGKYRLGWARPDAMLSGRNCRIGKWWANHKVPSFLGKLIPVIWNEEKGESICHEFLTGKTFDFEQSAGVIKVCIAFNARSKGAKVQNENFTP